MKCLTKFCRGCPTQSSRSRYCAKCRARRWKERSPLRYAFGKLRYRAKERGHEFLLTFPQYVLFAVQTGYAEKKGKTALSLSIDRIDPRRGYVLDNIRAVALRENSRAQWLPPYIKQQMERATA